MTAWRRQAEFHSKLLLLAQIAAHLSLIPMVVLAEPHHYILLITVYFFMGCLGMSMTYHRLLAHNSWKAPKWLEVFGLFSGTIGLTGSCIAWGAVHRRHHQTSDTIADPHSPRYMGFFRAQYLSMFYAPNPYQLRPFLKNRLHVWFHRHYWAINLSYAFVLGLVDPMLVVAAYLAPAALLWNAGSLVNTIGHMWGYKTFQTKDEGRNNPVLALLTWGEGWHNNHHRYPKSAQFGLKFWEVDVSYFLISIFRQDAHRVVLDEK